MKRIVRAGIAVRLIVIAVCSLMTGCSSEKSSAAAGSQGDPSGKASQAEEAPFPDPKEESASGSSSFFQAPEEGYYSNAYDEILKIRKSSGGTYAIEYSITRQTGRLFVFRIGTGAPGYRNIRQSKTSMETMCSSESRNSFRDSRASGRASFSSRTRSKDRGRVQASTVSCCRKASARVSMG